MSSRRQTYALSLMPETTSDIALLLSGGLDSGVLLGRLLDRGQMVRPIYVDSGLAWQQAELAALRGFLTAVDSEQIRPLVVLQMPLDDVYSGHWSLTGQDVPDLTSGDEAVYLPGRNALLLVKSALWCHTRGIRRLALGVLSTSPFADAGAGFFEQFEGAMNTALGGRLCLLRPLVGFTKRAVMQLGDGLPLGLTFSCVAPMGPLHCGRCNKCAERHSAFVDAGLHDPTEYAIAVSLAE